MKEREGCLLMERHVLFWYICGGMQSLAEFRVSNVRMIIIICY